MTNRREIVLINKKEGSSSSLLDKIEKLSRIAAAFALPLIVGVGGWWIQDALSRRDTEQDYVELAVSILSKPQDKTQSELREWATNLLAATSPVEIPDGLKQKLGGGEVQLPAVLTSSAFSPVSELSKSDPRSKFTQSIARFDTRSNEGVITCTAWLVSAFQILTANHCLSVDEEPVDTAKALFGYTSPTDSISTRFVDLMLPAMEMNETLNFAVLEFEEGTRFTGTPLSFSAKVPNVGDKLYVLHHPSGRELSFSLQPCRILSLDRNTFTHNCDTIAGASGAPLINADTLEVVGMHIGEKLLEGVKIGVRLDEAVRSSKVLQRLSRP